MYFFQVPICNLSIIFFFTYAKTKINDQILLFDPNNTKGGRKKSFHYIFTNKTKSFKYLFYSHYLIIFWLKIDCDAEEYFGTPCMLFRTLWQVTLLICHGSYFWPDSLLCCCTSRQPYKATKNNRKGNFGNFHHQSPLFFKLRNFAQEPFLAFSIFTFIFIQNDPNKKSTQPTVHPTPVQY